jgi:hypothetical protein
MTVYHFGQGASWVNGANFVKNHNPHTGSTTRPGCLLPTDSGYSPVAYHDSIEAQVHSRCRLVHLLHLHLPLAITTLSHRCNAHHLVQELDRKPNSYLLYPKISSGIKIITFKSLSLYIYIYQIQDPISLVYKVFSYNGLGRTLLSYCEMGICMLRRCCITIIRCKIEESFCSSLALLDRSLCALSI